MNRTKQKNEGLGIIIILGIFAVLAYSVITANTSGNAPRQLTTTIAFVPATYVIQGYCDGSGNPCNSSLTTTSLVNSSIIQRISYAYAFYPSNHTPTCTGTFSQTCWISAAAVIKNSFICANCYGTGMVIYIDGQAIAATCPPNTFINACTSYYYIHDISPQTHVIISCPSTVQLGSAQCTIPVKFTT